MKEEKKRLGFVNLEEVPEVVAVVSKPMNQPQYINLQVGGSHIGSVWGTASVSKHEEDLGGYMIKIPRQQGGSDAFLHVDRIEKSPSYHR